MNKKKMILLIATVGALLILVLAILLIGRGCSPQQAPSGAGSDAGQTTNLLPSDMTGTDGTATDGTAGDPTGTETVPDITASVGVGDMEDWGGDDTQDSTKPSQNSTQTNTPTQGNQSSQGNNTKPDNSGNTSSGNSGSSSGNGSSSDWLLSWEEFMALTGPQQDDYFYRFEDPLDYKAWFNAAKKEYEEGQFSVIATGPVDLSTLPNE